MVCPTLVGRPARYATCPSALDSRQPAPHPTREHVRLAIDLPSVRPPRHLLRATALAATLAWVGPTATACSHPRPVTTPAAGSATADTAQSARDVVGPVEVRIENRGTFEVVVYAVRGSIRRRLATVSPVSTAVAVVPSTFTDDRGGVQFYARPLAGNSSFTSDNVYPRTGDRLVLTLQSRIIESTLVVQ